MLKTLIVDDEARSRRTLKALCEEFVDAVEVCCMAGSVDEAIKEIATHQPDLVFLDIQMPVKSGFALLDHFTEKPLPFSIIFTTAFDQYAIQAFRYAATDYLLKPIEIDDLIAAVAKVKRKPEPTDQTQERLNILQDVLDRQEVSKIALTTTDGFTFVNFEEIIRCEAQGNYTEVFMDNGNSFLITKTLKHYEENLSERGFFRVHKKHLINLRFVRRFIKGKQGMVEMQDGKMIEVSFRKREALLERLQQRD